MPTTPTHPKAPIFALYVGPLNHALKRVLKKARFLRYETIISEDLLRYTD